MFFPDRRNSPEYQKKRFGATPFFVLSFTPIFSASVVFAKPRFFTCMRLRKRDPKREANALLVMVPRRGLGSASS